MGFIHCWTVPLPLPVTRFEQQLVLLSHVLTGAKPGFLFQNCFLLGLKPEQIILFQKEKLILFSGCLDPTV